MKGIRPVSCHVTAIAEAPYIVSITYRDQHICSAALLQANIVLTAAHYFPSRIGNQVADRHQYRAYAGLARLSDAADSEQQAVRLAYVVIHPEYDASTADNDVAVVRLKRFLQIGDTVRLIALPGPGFRMPEEHAAEVTGWCRAKVILS